MEVERSIEVTKLPRVVVADVQTEESEERWRNDLNKIWQKTLEVKFSDFRTLLESSGFVSSRAAHRADEQDVGKG